MGESGLLTSHWPVEYGGRGDSLWDRIILGEEMWGAGEPRGPQYMNVNWIASAIMLAGTDAQKDRFLPEMARGEVFWAQGFSEPEAGSDLASLRTRAVRDGDEYIVNGQKVWTSYAHEADFCFLLVRTNPDVSKHQGISILLVPMNSPGIEDREIPSPFARHLIHEIFFTDVRVPIDCRLGAEDSGWGIVRHALAEERVGVARYSNEERILNQAIDEARCRGVDVDDPVVADTLGQTYALIEAARTLMLVAVQEQIDDPTGRRPMAPVWRALGAGMAETATRRATMTVMGTEGLVDGSAADQMTTLGTFSPIVAGAFELQLNLVAQTCLGLPKER
jgi:alkylation response protein AidB-like acyl-CoA dehydrogenase